MSGYGECGVAYGVIFTDEEVKRLEEKYLEQLQIDSLSELSNFFVWVDQINGNYLLFCKVVKSVEHVDTLCCYTQSLCIETDLYYEMMRKWNEIIKPIIDKDFHPQFIVFNRVE